MSSLSTERAKKAIMVERSAASTWKTKKRQRESATRMREIKGPSCPRPPLDTVALRASRPRLDPDPSEASSDDEGNRLFIARARTKGVPWEVLVAKTSQILIPRKRKASLMTGSLVFLCRVERC